MSRRGPVRQLPDAYREVYYFNVLDTRLAVKVNVLGLLLMVVALGGMALWVAALPADSGLTNRIGQDLPGWVSWVIIIGVLPLHEWIHGIVIRLSGERPRYGVISAKLARFIKLPIALYATTDGIYFPRNTFIIIALAPLVVISLIGMALTLVVAPSLVNTIAIAVSVNTGGAIGDLWMSVVALGYAPDALVLDEADSIRIYVTNEKERSPAPE